MSYISSESGPGSIDMKVQRVERVKLLCQWSSSEQTGISSHHRTKKTSKHENIKCLIFSLYLLCFFKYLMCLGMYFMMFRTLNITQKGKGMLGYCGSHKRSIDHSLIGVVILR